MGGDFVAALDLEIAELARALGDDIRFRRLRELERLRRELYGEVACQNDFGGASIPQFGARNVPMPPLRKPSPERTRVVEVAQELVRKSSGPVPTSAIFAHTQRLGIPIAGENPHNNLSAILSNSGLFQANGRAGWTLKPAEEDFILQERRGTEVVAGKGRDDPDEDIPF